ncbi:hypothetical protein D9757_009621 [Collybiopsis confluens]|uniref:Uncharacterized protein n=1 Tax=Collybiopsis confluens TaxID=2823264 RepID=A0A8H5GW49_9AGAR|nr:hypothetical protein D9757_009621 [Collybiopsis confluens]
MDYDTPFCPVCDKQVAPKRTTQLITESRPLNGSPGSARSRNAQNRPVTKTRTIIEQGPFPLYCSDECKMADMLNPTRDSYAPPTYHIFHSTKSEPIEPSSFSDIESDSLCSMSTTDVSYTSPTSESPDSTPFKYQPKQRSKSFLVGRESRMSGARLAPASLPSTSSALADAYEGRSTSDASYLEAFYGSFTRRCESRVSMFSGPSSPTGCSPPSGSALSTSPRRERPLLAHGAEGKLLVPDFVRRPTSSRRESSSSIVSMASIASAPGAMTTRNRTGSMASIASSRASMASPLARYGSDFGDDERYDLSEEDEDEYANEDSNASGLGGLGFTAPPSRPLLGEMRAWSFDGAARSAFSTIREPRKERRTIKKEKRQSYNPDGKKLFLFPTD